MSAITGSTHNLEPIGTADRLPKRPIPPQPAGSSSASRTLHSVPLVAFIDESQRQRAHCDGAHVYTLTAVLIETEHHDKLRAALRDLRFGKSPRLHWRTDRRPEHRDRVINSICQMPLHSVITVHLYQDTAHERARRACLNAMLPHLSGRQVGSVVLESRGEPKDKRDREVVTYLRKMTQVRHDMAIGWERPDPEPLLWLPDCIGGAVTAWVGDDDDRYYRHLESNIEFIDARSP